MNNETMKKIVLQYPDKILAPFDALYDELGYEALCSICDLYGGSTLYIPTKKRLFSKCFNEEIKKEFDGGNYRELSKKYDVCERTIRYVVTDYRNLR